MEKLTERQELLNSKDMILSDEALKQSPAYKQSPHILDSIMTFAQNCSADTAFEVLRQYQKTITVKLPDTISAGDVGAKDAREKLKIIERINSWWIWHYCICTYTDINPMLHVLHTDFTAPVLKRRSKKPKTPPQAPRARRQDNRHSTSNHPPRNDNRRNTRSASPWSNAREAFNHTQPVPSKSISNNGGKRWNNLQGKYI